jgi:hypothetical protein
MDLRKSTLRYLHSVFDDDPGATLGLTVENESAFSWAVSGETLTVDGQAIVLRGHSLADTAQHLRSLGLSASVPAALESRSAVSLIDGAGQGTTVQLQVQNSILWALSLPGALAQLEGQRFITDALAQLNFMTAGGGWLDLWGRYFDVPRLDDQTDAEYAEFIKREVLRPRSSVFAIQTAVRDWTGRSIVIREPHKELFIWDKSRWDGTDSRWQDGRFYTFGTFEPRAPIDDWSSIVPVIQRNRALGSVMLPPVWGLDAVVLTINPGPIPVGFSGLSEVRTSTVDGELAGNAGAGMAITQSVPVFPPAARWTDVGAWDTRTWQQGANPYGVGVAISSSS